MKVRVSEHARFDSFPLRYGFVPDEFMETSSELEDAVGTNNQKPREIKAGNKHLVCRLWSLTGDDLGKARIVLSPASESDPLPKIVTALSIESIPADRAVSEIIQLKRRRGEITTDFIVTTLHPLYIQQKLNSPESLVDIFVQIGIAEAERKGDLLRSTLAQASEESEALARRNEELESKYEALAARILQQEQGKANYRNEGVRVSPIAVLEQVDVRPRTNSRGETVNCTYLRFREPGLPERKMDEVFDRNGSITDRARALKGRRVRTATWRPEVFKPLEWFRDIYPVDG
ncbi:MAG: hypothetical protein J0L57_10630 [Burkholderiales bacterium]|jgi:hypothetical protein|nr:hypothetical protein [Burkholderiales bacterium]